jgi:gas vesicle protein
MRKRRIRRMRNSAGKFLTGFFIGGLIGTTLAMLYAPMDGRKLRKKLVKTTDDIMDDVNDYIGTSKHKADEMIKLSRKKAESIVNEAKKLIS